MPTAPKPKSPPCRYTVESGGEIVARFLLFTEADFFLEAAGEAGMFGELGAVGYRPNGEVIRIIRPVRRERNRVRYI